MSYGTLCYVGYGTVPLSSNILEFMKALPVCAKERGVTFSTPTDIITKLKSVDQVDVPYPIVMGRRGTRYQSVVRQCDAA